jgi:hypothetical protein
MDVTLHIPDALAARLAGTGDVARRAIEALALEELRAGRISEAELGDLLGLARTERDGFLTAHGIDHSYTLDDVLAQAATLERLGV